MQHRLDPRERKRVRTSHLDDSPGEREPLRGGGSSRPRGEGYEQREATA